LHHNTIIYKIFNYDTKYDETAYIEYLKHAKYGIWIGCHESQGFALEEALSCDVPLIVWNVKSMNEEYKSNYENIPATAIPYWDERCGEVFYNLEEFAIKMPIFLSKLNTYKPREYILQNLSMKVCEERLINIITESQHSPV
jgi:glycosyltransferase involved in cell wall biosynthesis